MITKRLKSKTYQLSFLTGAIGLAITNFDMIKVSMGDYSGYIFLALSIAGMGVRELTKTPIDEKE